MGPGASQNGVKMVHGGVRGALRGQCAKIYQKIERLRVHSGGHFGTRPEPQNRPKMAQVAQEAVPETVPEAFLVDFCGHLWSEAHFSSILGQFY